MGNNDNQFVISNGTKGDVKKYDDGVYIEKCDVEDCRYWDSRGFCHFETCVIKGNFIKAHKTHFRKCKLCEQSMDFTDLNGDICESCLKKIKQKYEEE